jgi:small subunit ribosomal protein S2
MVTTSAADMKTLYDAGAHVGYARTRRHPTSAPFLYSTKDRTDIFNLEETEKRLATAAEFAASLAQAGKTLLFVGGKHEAASSVRSGAESAGLPFVAGRWIGGTLTNFRNIRKRIDRMEKLMKDRESGELEKYTKKERLMIDREIEELQGRFGGITNLRDLPAALFVVDSRHEKTAVEEANQMRIPVISLASSDCDFSKVQFPIPANDTSVKSIALIVDAIASAYSAGKRAPAAK